MAAVASVIDFLSAPSGGYLYPVTLVEAIYDLDGNDLQTILDSYLPLTGGTLTGTLYFAAGSSLTGESPSSIYCLTSDTSYAYKSYIDLTNNTAGTDTGSMMIAREMRLSSNNSGGRSFINLSNEYLEFGRTEYGANGVESLPESGDAIVFEYYDSNVGDYAMAASIDGLTGNISVFKNIISSAAITPPTSTSTTPISITIGNCTKEWDGSSPLSFTLEEIGITS